MRVTNECDVLNEEDMVVEYAEDKDRSDYYKEWNEYLAEWK